jgi:hypothetical protein
MALLAGLASMPSGQAAAQTFTIIKTFVTASNVPGLNPYSTLVQGPDGTLCGATAAADAMPAKPQTSIPCSQLGSRAGGLPMAAWGGSRNTWVSPANGLYPGPHPKAEVFFVRA